MVSRSESKVYFFFQNTSFSLRKRKSIKKLIENIFKIELKRLDRINYIFCTDKALLSINKKYLGRNYYTDIITFNLSENESPIFGEVYISLGRVRANALLFGTSLKSELLRVICHGALHLCGYNDQTKKEALIMRSKEDYYMLLFSKSN